MELFEGMGLIFDRELSGRECPGSSCVGEMSDDLLDDFPGVIFHGEMSGGISGFPGSLYI